MLSLTQHFETHLIRYVLHVLYVWIEWWMCILKYIYIDMFSASRLGCVCVRTLVFVKQSQAKQASVSPVYNVEPLPFTSWEPFGWE